METFDTATLDDLPALTELLTLLFAQEAEFTPDAATQARGLRLILSTPAVGCIFVARADEGGRVIGMMSLLATVSTAEGAPAAWLEDVIVDPDHRGGGLGSRLLGYVVAQARERGFVRLSLHADHENAGALRFYTRHGFETSAMVTMRLHL